MSKKRLIPDIITPNRLTYLRVALIPLFILFFYLKGVPGNTYIAAGIFAFAAITDLFDGIIARKYNMVTNMGKFLDPIADKILVSTALILLLTERGLFNCVFWGLEISVEAASSSVGYIVATVCICIIMARELMISGFRQVAATTGLVIAADKFGKYKTTFQDIAITVLIVAIGVLEINYTVGYWFALLGFLLLVVATVFTLLSGISYIVKNKQVLKS